MQYSSLFQSQLPEIIFPALKSVSPSSSAHGLRPLIHTIDSLRGLSPKDRLPNLIQRGYLEFLRAAGANIMSARHAIHMVDDFLALPWILLVVGFDVATLLY